MSQCKQCRTTLSGQNTTFCSQDCYDQWRKNHVSPLAKLLLCPNCGKEFFLKDVGSNGSHVLRDQIFCSQLCRQYWTDEEVRKLREAGEPLVAINGDQLTCRICGQSLKVIGSHFAQTHGMNTRGLGKLERQFVFGIKRGERLVSDPVIAGMRTRAMPQGLRDNLGQYESALTGYWTEKNKQRRSDLLRAVPLMDSAREKVLAGVRRNAYQSHTKSCITVLCRGCGQPIHKIKSSIKTFCSHRCASANRSKSKVELTDDLIAEIKRGRERGSSRKQIASDLGLTVRQVKRSINTSNKSTGKKRS